jgi:hypothetical protein
MKIVTKTLSQALEYVCKCSDKKDKNFKYALCKYNQSCFSMKSVNTHMQLAVNMPIQNDETEEWEIVIDPFMLKTLISNFSKLETDLTITVDDKQLVINISNGGTYNLQIYSVDEFCDTNRFSIDGVDFTPISSIIFNNISSFSTNYASKDETKQILTGVNISLDQKSEVITSYATNGHMLSRLVQPLLNGEEKSVFIPCTIPKETLDLIKVFNSSNSNNSTYEFDLAFDNENGLIFYRINNVDYSLEFISNINQDMYPNIENLIVKPTKFEVSYTVSPLELYNAIKALTVYEKKHIVISDNILKQELVLESASDIGSGVQKINCKIDNLTDKNSNDNDLKFRMGFDPNYLMAICKDYFDYPLITISRESTKRLLTFIQKDETGNQDFLSLLMLIQLRE